MPTGLHPTAAGGVLDYDRLRALDATHLVGTEPEREFDRLTALAARVADSPTALVTLVGADALFLKSTHGLGEIPPGRTLPLSHALCQFVVGSGEALVVDDAQTHPLARHNGAVTEMGVGAYLGVPVRAPSGHVLGSICAIDVVARSWTDGDRESLMSLAAAVEGEIALREQLSSRELAESLARLEAATLATIVEVNTQLAAELDPDRLVQAVVDAGTTITRAAFGAFVYLPGAGVDGALLFAVSGAPMESFERLRDVRMMPLFEPSFSGREAVLSDDLETDARYGGPGWMPESPLTLRSYLSVPVCDADKKPLGALVFGHPDTGVFDKQTERAAEAIATQAAIALQNARLHRALDNSERRHRMVLANLNDIVFQTDTDGRYTYLNEAWTQKTGYAVSESVGRHALAFATGDVQTLGEYVVWLTHETKKGDDRTFQFPVEVLHADGSTLHMETNWRPAYDETGAHTGWAGTFTDVTDTIRFHAERKARKAAEAATDAAEQATAAAEDAKVEAERMARLKSAFLSNMSHEIRTPLTAVLGNAELLDEEVPEDLRDLTGAVLSGGRRLLKTLNAVLDLAQIEAGHMEPSPRRTDMRGLLASAARDLGPLAVAKGIGLGMDLPESLPVVLVDAGLVDRIVYNLVGNAVKFTEHGGVILRARHEGGALRIEVSDSGIGIPEAALPHLFDEFQQVSDGDARTHEGNGLGLALVHRVTSLLGGRVRVESTVGVGSRFTVSLPAAEVLDVSALVAA